MPDLVEFTPLGPCPECGSHRWREAICRCGEGVSRHNLGKRKGETVRTDCSRYGCGCKIFAEAAA